jgi:hypothetical protein
VRGARVCPVADGATAPDPDCVQAVEDAEIRIRVTLPGGGGLDFTVMIGPGRAAPLVIGLRRDSLDAALDLGEAKEALLHLAAVAGEDLQLPSTMRGRIGVNLTRHGARHIEISLGVRDAIEVSGTMDKGPYDLDVAASDPLLRVELDAPRGRHAIELDVGRVTLAAPWQALSSESKATGQMSFELRGATFAAVLAETLTITGVGLGDGPLTIKLDGTTILGVDLDHLDVEIVPAGAFPRILLSPGLEVVVQVATKKLADAGDVVSAWTHDETVTVRAGQEVGPYLRGVKAVRGAISVSTLKAGAGVTAAEGQCLTGSPLTAGEHPLIGLFAAVPCP